jgi:hypothetical protein
MEGLGHNRDWIAGSDHRGDCIRRMAGGLLKLRYFSPASIFQIPNLRAQYPGRGID